VGAFINGTVGEVSGNTNLTTYKIRFDAPISTEVWYSKGEAVTWRDVYVNRTATTASTKKARSVFNALTILGTPLDDDNDLSSDGVYISA
jgi:hypothetical protein